MALTLSSIVGLLFTCVVILAEYEYLTTIAQ